MKRRSLLLRLLAIATALVAIGVIAVNVTMLFTLRSSLLAQIDQGLRDFPARIPDPRSTGDRGLGDRGPDRDRGGEADFLRDSVVAQFNGSTGAVVRTIAGPGVNPDDLPDFAPFTRQIQAADVARVPLTIPSTAGGSGYRALALPTPPGSADVLVVATSLREMDDTLARVVLINALISLGLLVLLVGAGIVVIRIGLRPLTDVERAAASIRDGDLSVRAPHGDEQSEVGDLARTFNAMVDQIQDALAARAAKEAQLRRFVADASHELRTPLTSIRAYAELFQQGAVRSDAEARQAIDRIASESVRMAGLVDDLLLLARLDEQRPLRTEQVDCSEVADAVAADIGVSHPDHPVVRRHEGEHVPIAADPDGIHRIVANLARNAAIHTPAGTSIRITTETSATEVTITVADDGPGMAPGVAASAFERFSRGDEGRSRATAPGTGLGLSIVAALVAAHRGRVELTSTNGVGTTVAVALPRH